MAILEGMACGKAIISTNVGAIPEVVFSENGFLVNPGDVEALAMSIIKASSDSNYLNKISFANIRKIKDSYSMTVMHYKLAQLYEGLYSQN